MPKPKVYVDGMLVEWGTRLFYEPVRAKKGPKPVQWPKTPSKPSGADSAASDGTFAPSANQIRQKLMATVTKSPEVMVKITGGGKGMLHIAKHMEYISRNGELPLENEQGEIYQGIPELQEAKDDFRFMFEPVPEESFRKEAYNIALSMPRGTDVVGLKNAAREFAAENFPDHQYFFAMHEPGSDVREDPSENPHVHIVIKMASKQGVRLNLRKADLQRLRESFAEKLLDNGIRANATKRQARGQNNRYRKANVIHLEQSLEKKGETPTTAFVRGPQQLTPRSRATQNRVWESYEHMARALSESPDQEDKHLAKEIVQFIKSTPLYLEQNEMLKVPPMKVGATMQKVTPPEKDIDSVKGRGKAGQAKSRKR